MPPEKRVGRKFRDLRAVADPEFLPFLLAREEVFHEELHLAGSGQKALVCLPGDGWRLDGGWFLTQAEPWTGEWNLAKPFGVPEVYVPFLGGFPLKQEFHLLVPGGDEREFCRLSGLKPCGRIHVFFGDSAFIQEDAPSPTAFHLQWREQQMVHPFNAVIEGHCLDENSRVIGFIRTTHATPTTMEVYIEVHPACRSRGIGTALLQGFRCRLRGSGRNLLYLLEEENHPSRRIAEKTGLVLKNIWFRYVFSRDSGDAFSAGANCLRIKTRVTSSP
jgi:GNAT superfamily N-acetyltransferase